MNSIINLNDKILLVFQKVINPISGRTLADEKRLLKAQENSTNIVVEYSRDGLDIDTKKTIEHELNNLITEELNTDKELFLIAKSENSKEVWNGHGKQPPQQTKNPAALKIGHGQVGEKKRINGVKNVFAIASGKGGVGKSTFTSNLAVTLQSMGRSVGIIDADIYGPSMPMLMDRRNIQPEATEDKKIIPLENYGIKFLSFGSFINEDEPVVWRGPMLGGVLNQFFFEADWGELDYLIIDLPPGTGDVQLSMIQNIVLDGAIVISTPQDIALLDAKKGLNMFVKLKIPVLGMVENMSSFICDGCDKEHFIFGAGGVSNAATGLGVGYLGSIPLELALRKGADFGKPYMSNEIHQGKKVWQSYKDIAGRIDKYFFPQIPKQNFVSKIFGRKNDEKSVN